MSESEYIKNHPDYPYVYNYSKKMLRNQGLTILSAGFIIGIYLGVAL